MEESTASSVSSSRDAPIKEATASSVLSNNETPRVPETGLAEGGKSGTKEHGRVRGGGRTEGGRGQKANKG